ncbi:MAG: DsbA family oxidoreductase [Alphaproteobacteria bacterium]
MKSQAKHEQTSLTIEIFADVICPWCYIGKRRLDAALAARPHVRPQIIWRAFLLNPTMPKEGMRRSAYLAAKFGHSAAAVYGRVAAAGMDSGIHFNFDAIERTPNSRAAQKLLLAAGTDTASLSEALYRAYFIDGRDLGDEQILADILTSHDRTDLATAISSETINRQMDNDIATANQLKLDGVPYFIFGGKFAVAGAHLPEHLIPAIDAATA